MSGFRRDPREAGGGGGFTPAGEPLPPTPPPPPSPLSTPPDQPQVDPKATMGAEIFGRKWKLTLFPSQSTKGHDLSELHFTFTVTIPRWQSPTQLDCLVYNVSETLIDTMALQQYSRVILEAGYHSPQSRYGTIFDGSIFYFSRQRLNPTDTALRIIANKFDPVFTQAYMNGTLDAGYTPQDLAQACLDKMKEHGVEGKQLSPDIPADKSPRGRTILGPIMDGVMRDFSNTHQTSCTFTEKQMMLMKEKDVTNKEAFVLNSKSGLIGVAQQELGRAVAARSLLNPLFVPMCQIHINEREIARLFAPKPTEGILPALPDQQFQRDQLTARTRADGFYPVHMVTHHGDTRGLPWYSDLRTVPPDPKQAGPQIGGKG